MLKHLSRGGWPLALLLALSAGRPQEPPAPSEPVIQVPPGFVVERVAGPPLFDYPMFACFDDRGRLFVCTSSGFNLLKGGSEILVKDPPHAIRRIEDSDGDGRFDKAALFADRMTFPMGVLWHEGALFTASAPSYWRLEDTDGDGVADKRREIVTKFDFGGNGCDVHGPFLGPDGRLYWANCQRGYDIRRPDGSVLKGKTAGVFRSRGDGSDLEILWGGGMDNPVEVAFTEEGEGLVTANIVAGNPRQDAILHGVEGGNFPKGEGSREFKRTGDLLPMVTDLGWVAPAGLMRYRSGAFGPEYRDNFFSAQFNVHKIQRHVVERDGATFRSRNEDFLVSTHPDFHPTDVLEDADGSLLVVDTGGWFLRGCPSSRVEKPQAKGGIYRVRRTGMARAEDARGLSIAWGESGPEKLTALLDDARFAVRDRALAELARRGEGAVEALRSALGHASPQIRRNAVWALTRIDGAAARKAARAALSDRDPGVRIAATYSAGLHRDRDALAELAERVRTDDAPHVRREAATALGRIQDARAVPALLECVRSGGDRFLEHALLYALIRIDAREATLPGLQDADPRVRRGALIALDQMASGNLTRELVTPHLDPSNPALLQAAVSIIKARPAWANELQGLLRDWLSGDASDGQRREELLGVLVAFAAQPAIQDLVAQTLRQGKTSPAMRVLLLDAIARAPLDRLPPTWTAEARWQLDSADERVVRQAVTTLRSAGVADFDAQLVGLAREGSRAEDVRAEALAAAAPRLSGLEAPLFQFLLACLGKDKPALLRLTAAQALGSAALSEAQLGTLAQSLTSAGALEMPRLVGAFERSTQAQTGGKLVAALQKSPVLESLTPDALRRALKGYPEDVKKSAEPLLRRLDMDGESDRARIAELERGLPEGGAAKGRDVFLGKKAACTACHSVQGQGGRVGPDLTKIGAIRSRRDLLEAIVSPSASFVRGYEPFRIRTRDGAVYEGVIGRETADAVYLVQADRSEKRVPSASIETILQSRLSIMPKGLDQQLAREELADLVAFLLSLK